MAKEWRYKYKSAKKAEVLSEFEDWEREDLINHILELRAKITGMEGNSSEIRGNSDAEVKLKKFSESDYKQSWSYPTKIAFLITLNDKPMTSEEIHQQLLKLDLYYKDYINPRNNLTVTINRALSSGRIKKIKVPGLKKMFYALPIWFEKDEVLKEKYATYYDEFK